MVRHIAAAGYVVRAWNRTQAKVAPLAADGVTVCDSAAAAARGATHIVLMLSDGPICDAVLNDGVYDELKEDTMLLVMASIDMVSTMGQVRECEHRRIRYVDAPVSGGELGAQEGKLAIMAGGRAEDFAAACAIFQCMGRPTHVGPAGSGQLAKLTNQVIVAMTIMAVSESFILAEAGGADLKQVREALLGGFADSTIMRQHAMRMINKNFVPGGPAKHQVKDLRGALAVAREHGLDLPMLRHAEETFAAFVAAGGGDLDHSAVIEHIRKQAS